MSGLSYLMGVGMSPVKNFAGIVVQRGHRHRAGIYNPAEAAIFNHGQGVGQHRHLVGVLLDVLQPGVAHEPPAVDIPHPGNHGKKVVGQGKPLLL